MGTARLLFVDCSSYLVWNIAADPASMQPLYQRLILVRIDALKLGYFTQVKSTFPKRCTTNWLGCERFNTVILTCRFKYV